MKVDPSRLTRWIKRLALPVLLIGAFLFIRSYWFFVVPKGMDTLPDLYPPGTTCVVQRNPSKLVANSVIFLEVQVGAAPILVRVGKVEAGLVFPRIENLASRFAGYTGKGYPLDQVRFLVLSGFVPDPVAPGPAVKRSP